MSSKKTISTRYKDWIIAEPIWAYLTLFCFGMVFVGLMIHLGVIAGALRYWGLVMVIVFDSLAILITALRKQWWWCSFFGFITTGVIGWELASYFL